VPAATAVDSSSAAAATVVAAAAASGHLYCWVVGNQAAIHKGAHAGLSLIWCRVDESSCRAQPCQRTHQNGQTASSTAATFIRTLPERIWGGETRRGGGGGRPGGCEAWYYRELVKVALLLMPSFQIVLLVYRGLAGRHLACRLG